MKFNISNFLLNIILIKTDHEFCWRQIVILLIPFELDEGERLWQTLNDLEHAYKIQVQHTYYIYVHDCRNEKNKYHKKGSATELYEI